MYQRMFGKKNETNQKGKTGFSMPKIRFSTRYIINKKDNVDNINVFVARKNRETNKNKAVRRVKKIKVRSNLINPKVKYPEQVTQQGGTKKTIKKYNKK